MKYKAAESIGRDCGLTLPAEFINNIEHVAMMIFKYKDIERELAELRQDAIAHGIRFSKVCGCAILAEDSEEYPCYTCRKLKALHDKRADKEK